MIKSHDSGELVSHKIAALIAAVFLLFNALVPVAHAATQPRVLILHSYHQGSRWTDNIMAGVQTVFARDMPEAALYVEYMDTKRNAPETLFPKLAELYVQKYRGVRFDVIISSDDNALTFLTMYRKKVFPGAPVVFCGINDLSPYDISAAKGFTGVIEDFDLKSTLDLALKLHPKTRMVVSVSDSTPSSRVNLRRLKQLAPEYKGRVTFRHLFDLTTEELELALKTLPKESIVLHLNFFRDRNGKTYSAKDSIRLVADMAQRPMYGAWDWYLGWGVTGGLMTSGVLQGETSARMAIRIIRGAPLENIPIAWESPKAYMFDYDEMRKFGLGMDDIPKESIVINKPESFYWKYKSYIWAASAAFAALVLVIVVLTLNIRRRKKIENELTAIFDNSLVGIMLLQGKERVIAKVNKRIEDIFGYSEYELLNNPPKMIHLSDEQYDHFGEHFHDTLQKGDLFHREFEYRRKDGTHIWCLVSGKALDPLDLERGVLWVMDDITEQRAAQVALQEAHQELERRVKERTHELSQSNKKLEREVAEHRRAEEALRQREKKYYENLELIFGSLPDAIVTVDDSMRIIEANKAFEHITGLPRRTLLGNNIRDVMGNCLGPCMRVLTKTMESRAPVKEEQVMLEGERSNQVVALSTSMFLNHDGEHSGVVLEIRDITRLVELEKQLHQRRQFQGIVGKSEQMQDIYATLDKLADFDSTVLILGESGTGKELVAEAIHYGGANAEAPFIKVNCSALSENLLESELFGHVKGAFTGAYKDKIGRFEAAEGGTVFLDEIGEISSNIQVKLLRFLERREFERVGESRTIKANVRIIVATNADLREMVLRGTFREDLYYRLKVMVVTLPPLRERTGDVKLLVEHFVAHFRELHGHELTSIDERAMSALARYPWPGNVRELKHALEHACIVSNEETLNLESLPSDIRNFEARQVALAPMKEAAAKANPGAVEEKQDKRSKGLTREAVMAALEEAKWNKSKASRILGISRRHLYRKLEDFGIS